MISPARRSFMVFSLRAAGVSGQPAQTQGLTAVGPDLDRDLVGGAADTASLDLQQRA